VQFFGGRPVHDNMQAWLFFGVSNTTHLSFHDGDGRQPTVEKIVSLSLHILYGSCPPIVRAGRRGAVYTPYLGYNGFYRA